MKQTDIKGIQDNVRMGRKSNPSEIMQEIKIWPYIERVWWQNKGKSLDYLPYFRI